MGERKDRSRQFKIRAPTPVARRIRAIRHTLVDLTLDEKGQIELIPFGDQAFALVGEPPDVFRLTWITPKGFTNLDDAVAQGKLPADTLSSLREQFRAAYERTPWDIRYHADVGDRSILVTISEPLEAAAREAAHALPT